MKARIRGTNIELDVQPFYDETGYFSGFKDGYEYYRAADLVFPETPDWDKTDWSSFRREAAKDIVCAILSAGMEQTNDKNEHFHSFEELARVSVKWADELIKQLKEDEK